MPPPQHQRQWQVRSQQKALLEFASLKYAVPEGIHVSLNPSDPSVWTGVFFVRKGPYESAVLRFRVVLPPSYPDQPPSISFTSDVFHPLVTPLTTYAGSAGSNTFSLSEEDRLPPGGFSLKYGFPSWFGKNNLSVEHPVPKAGHGALLERLGDSECDSDEHSTFQISQSPRNVPPLSMDAAEAAPPVSPPLSMSESVIDALYYLKKSFEDEVLLDKLPLDAASNTGAWSAWAAHRRAMGQEPAAALQVGQVGAQPQSGESLSRRGPPSSNWNWEGVWLKRVGAIKEAGTSDPVLFSSSGIDEPLHFLALDEETVLFIRANLS